MFKVTENSLSQQLRRIPAASAEQCHDLVDPHLQRCRCAGRQL
jgi:hypothetical protein